MKVKAKVFAGLARMLRETLPKRYPDGFRPGKPVEEEVPEASTVADLIDKMGIPRKSVHVVFVNAVARKLDYRLASDDEVGIFPPIGGG